MNFVWQTALSVLDISSSLIYQLLGRELNDTDIKLIEELFIYMSRPAPPLSLYIQEINTRNTLKNQMSDLDMVIAPSQKQHHHHHYHKHHHRYRHCSDEHDYLKELEMERIDFQTNTQKLVNFIKTLPKGKDLLLITCKKNGYNLIQLSMLNLLDYSFNLLNNYKKCFNFNGHKIDENNSSLKAIEYNYDLIMESKLELISLLLDYGCDPNRGLVLSNRNKFVINTDSPFFKLNNFAAAPVHQDNNNNNCNVDSIDGDTSKDEHMDHLYPHWSRPPVKSLASTHLPFMLNTDLSFITKSLVDEKKLNILNATPIDSPLLILCCVFNCHNLIGFNSHSNNNNNNNDNNANNNNAKAKHGGSSSGKNANKCVSSISSSSRQSTSSKKNLGASKRIQLKKANNLIKLNQQRRHTIHLGAGEEFKHQEQQQQQTQQQQFYLNKASNQNLSWKVKRDMEESGPADEEIQRRYNRRYSKVVNFSFMEGNQKKSEFLIFPAA